MSEIDIKTAISLLSSKIDRLETSVSKDLDKALYLLCSVIDQNFWKIDNTEKLYKTSYNTDAHAVWFLAIHGYTEIIEGAWPATKYIEFKFTDKYYSEPL